MHKEDWLHLAGDSAEARAALTQAGATLTKRGEYALGRVASATTSAAFRNAGFAAIYQCRYPDQRADAVGDVLGELQKRGELRRA